MRSRIVLPLITLLVVSLACAQTELPGTATPAPTDLPAPTPVAATSTVETPPAAPTPTATPTEAIVAASETPAPAASATPTTASNPTTGPGSDVYFDNRSDAQSLVWSYVNALARHEPLRAYGYWRDAPERPVFADMEAANQSLTIASVEIGQILADAGAGQRYFAVPALVTMETTDGNGVDVDCFYLHLSSPDLQAVPPFNPLGIERITSRPLTESDNAANALATACPADAGGPMEPLPAFDPTDLSATRYLDDRSDPVLVLRSMFNAINRQEYARAYGYWDATSAEARPFDDFEAGYADTRNVTLEFGTVVPDAGAGQYYFQVPLILRAETAAGAKQVYVACYTLHLSNPSFQATPPFQPLALRTGTARLVTEADAAARLQTICLP